MGALGIATGARGDGTGTGAPPGGVIGSGGGGSEIGDGVAEKSNDGDSMAMVDSPPSSSSSSWSFGTSWSARSPPITFSSS